MKNLICLLVTLAAVSAEAQFPAGTTYGPFVSDGTNWILPTALGAVPVSIAAHLTNAANAAAMAAAVQTALSNSAVSASVQSAVPYRAGTIVFASAVSASNFVTFASPLPSTNYVVTITQQGVPGQTCAWSYPTTNGFSVLQSVATPATHSYTAILRQ